MGLLHTNKTECYYDYLHITKKAAKSYHLPPSKLLNYTNFRFNIACLSKYSAICTAFVGEPLR